MPDNSLFITTILLTGSIEETIKFYETNILEDYLQNIIEEQYIRENINNFLNELDKYTKNYYSQKLKFNH